MDSKININLCEECGEEHYTDDSYNQRKHQIIGTNSCSNNNSENNILIQQLFTACKNNNYHHLKSIIDTLDDNNINNIIDINLINEDGWSLLGMACHYNRTNIVELLVSLPHININGIGRVEYNKHQDVSRVYTPLHLCCERDQVDVANILLCQIDIDVNQRSVLISHETSTRINIVNNIKNGTRHDNGKHVINIIRTNNVIDISSIPIMHGYDMKYISKPFVHACVSKSMNVIFALLDHPNLEIYNGSKVSSFLDVIVGHGFLPDEQHLSNQVIDAFMDREDVFPDINKSYFLKPILNCLDYGKYDVAENLINNITSVNNNITVDTMYELICDLENYSDTSYDYYDNSSTDVKLKRQQGKSRRQLLIGKLLTIYTSHINNVSRTGKTLLHICCEHGDYDLIDKVLNVDGIDVNIQDSNGDTPLHYCVRDTNHICTRLLLTMTDINLHIENHDNQTVIDDIVDEIIYELDYAGNVTGISNEGEDDNSQYYTEEYESVLQVADMLFSHDNFKDFFVEIRSKSLLHIGCYYHLPLTINRLLCYISTNNKHVVDESIEDDNSDENVEDDNSNDEDDEKWEINTKLGVNMKDKWGNTPLMEFCRGINIISDNDDNHDLDILKSLLTTVGIDVNVKDENCRSVLYFLCHNCTFDSKESMKYLLAAGAYPCQQTIDYINDFCNRDIGNLITTNERDNKVNVGHLIVHYRQNPHLLLKYQVEVNSSSKMFTTIVLLCDDYLRLNPICTHDNIIRFYNIVCKLPMDIQKILCHCMFGSSKQNISGALITKQAKIILNS